MNRYNRMRNLASMGLWAEARDLLKAEYAELGDALDAALTEAELLKLAGDLPFDHDAANLLWKPLAMWPNLTKATMLRQATPPEPGDETSLRAKRYRKADVALYCAAAAQYGVSKALAEVEEVTRRKLAMVKTIQEFVALADRPELALLTVALKRHDGDDDGDVHRVPGQGPDQAGAPGGDRAVPLAGGDGPG